RRWRRARARPADGVSSAHAELRRLPQAIAVALRRVLEDVRVRVAFLGPPGAGKGTQARELARDWNVPHVATGDMLRAAAAAGTPLARATHGNMDPGARGPAGCILGTPSTPPAKTCVCR